MYYPMEDPASRNSAETTEFLVSICTSLLGSFLLFFILAFCWTIIREGRLHSVARSSLIQQTGPIRDAYSRPRRHQQENRRAMSFCELVPPHLLPSLPDYEECSQPPPPFTERRAGRSTLKRVSTAPSSLTRPLELPSGPPSPMQSPGPSPRQTRIQLDPLAPRTKKWTCYGSFRSEVLPPPAYSAHVQD